NAGSATTGPGTAATVQQAGAGVLNVAAALSGTLAAYPTALNFGTGRGSIDQTLNLTLTNLGSASDTFTVSVVPSADGPIPQLASNTVPVDAGGSQPLGLSVKASGLAAGEYQGYVQVSGTLNPNVARIPYWFAVPGETAAGIAVLHSDDSDAALS